MKFAGVQGLIEEGEAFKTLSAASNRRDRRFYSGMALAFLVTALAGFGPSYYAKSVALAPPSLLVHVHALVFTGWLLLLVTQTSLVAARRVAWHRRLGMAGAALAVTMVPLGIMTAVASAARRSDLAPLALLELLMFQAGALVIFAAFIAAALWRRRSCPQTHKRLMLLATITLMPPALARFPFVGTKPALAALLAMLFVVAGIVYDLRARGRVHPAYVWGGLALLASGPLRLALAQTSAWESVARFLMATI